MEQNGPVCYTRQQDVMGLVIQRLYRGTSPDRKTLALNGRILNWLIKRGYDWDACARIVEGLALRRDQGKLLPTVQATEPVSLRWVWSKAMDINQVALCEDAFYAGQPKIQPKREHTDVVSITDILKGFTRGQTAPTEFHQPRAQRPVDPGNRGNDGRR